MPSPQFNVLYLDNTNSARSIMAEALLNDKSDGRITAYSAGGQPVEEVHPIVMEQLVRDGISSAGLRAKSWDEFTAPGAPAMQIIITLWDNASHPPCPAWPGSPTIANWGVSDPLYLTHISTPARELGRAFMGAYSQIGHRIDLLLALPLDSLDPAALQQELDRIGHL